MMNKENKELINLLREIVKNKLKKLRKFNSINYENFGINNKLVFDEFNKIINDDRFKLIKGFAGRNELQFRQYTLHNKFNIYMYIEGFKTALELINDDFVWSKDMLLDGLEEESI